MLTLNDGRTELWQWDTGRELTVDADCSQVHFSNKVFGRSIDVDVVDGIAIIPDILLQTDKELTAWAFVGTPENGYTKISKVFNVNKRNKPADYVFTPTDQATLGEILDRIEDLEKRLSGDVSKEDIQNAVSDYLDKNPVSVVEKDPTVSDWAKQTSKPKYTAKEVGAVSTVNGTSPDENGNVQIKVPDSVECAVLYTEQDLTEEQKAQARANIGAVDENFVERAIADATGGVDLSEYELMGDTPQYLAGADTKYNVVVDCKEETAVSIVSDTVAELASATNVKFNGCAETYDSGVYTLECKSDGAWYSVRKTFTLSGLVPGEPYRLMYDVTGVVQSDAITSEDYAHLMIMDLNGDTLISTPIYIGSDIKWFAFTPKSESVTVNLYTTTSSHANQIGNKIRYRDIWINKADAKEVRTDVYNFSITTSERLDLRDICGGVTITATPAAKVYTQMVEGDAPTGPLDGKTCVCFGDSITGNYTNPFDYPSIIARKTGMTVINGGFGGCRMAQHPSSAYTAFSMYNLANSVASGDWSVQDAAIASVGSANAEEHLAALKEVEWSAVDYITIFYGTNDFTGGVPIGEDAGSLSTSQYKGALRHSIETILTAYPKIRIVLITPIYRFWTENGAVTDSDSYEISGLKLTDYVEAVLAVADEYKLPVFNLYNSLGINKINRTVFLADGVHPSEAGLERIADSISAKMSAI
jgi:lysophospholipase L1-like esterase